MKNNALIIGSFVWLLAGACSSEKNSTAALDPIGQGKVGNSAMPVRNPALEAKVFGNWLGQLPCADCDGIAYRLTLQKDKTFEESSTYLGKNGTPFIEKGTWNLFPDSLLILEKSSGQAQFKISKNSLIKLDQQGRMVSSALAEKYRLRNNMEADRAAVWEAKRKQGIDFIGTGNSSNWSLEIDAEKTIRFSVQKENLQLSADEPTAQKLPDGKGMVYRGKTEAGSLTVRITNQPCSNKVSGATYAYSVEVTANAQSYMGCGEFLQDSRLNGNWTLQQMNNQDLNSTDFTKGLPTLTVDLKNQKAMGNSGCNQYSGNLDLKGDKVSFGNLISTRMACQGPAMTFESNYLKLLSGQNYTYEIESDKLKIRDKTNTLLEYKKTE